MPMVYVPAGDYRRGIDAKLENIPYDYYIGKYEVTNQQFFHFLTEALSTGDIKWKDDQLVYHYVGDSLIPNGDYKVKILDDRIYKKDGELELNREFSNHPVISVTYFGALAFCQYYGFELPTEAEWEKAARGNNPYWYPWGNDIDGSFANFFGSGDPYEPKTTPIGFYDGHTHGGFETSDAVSAYGCYDMAGNAWEWVKDKFNEHSKYNIGKGGGFNIHTAAYLQVYNVNGFGVNNEAPPIDICHLSDGFRVLRR